MAEAVAAKKSVRLVCSRPRKEFTVDVTPDETASSLLEKAGLNANDYIMLKPGDQSDFQPADAVWGEAVDGGKFHIVTQSSVGTGGQPGAAPRTYAQDMGWAVKALPDGMVYRGYFRAKGLRWQGQIQCAPDGRILVFIENPPLGFIRSTEWAGCFHATSTGKWFQVTFKPYAPAKDVDGAIAAVNKILGVSIRATNRAVA